jgi:hypothetical protein
MFGDPSNGSRMKRNALLVVIALGVVCPASAQSTDAIPRDVVMAILRNRYNNGPTEPEIVLGDRLPPGYDTRVSLPPNSRVIATLRSVGAVDIIGTVPGDPDEIRKWFAQQFDRRGYVGRPPGNFPRQDAFRDADGSPSIWGYCGQSWHFAVNAKQRASEVVEFVVHVIENGCLRGNGGYPQFGEGWSSGGWSPPPLPILYHPRFVDKSLACMAGSSNGGSTRQTQEHLGTTMNPNEMLAYYGHQLESAGWKQEGRFIGVVGMWTKRDSTGRDLRTTLSIQPSYAGADCRTVTLTTGDAHP